MLRRDLQSVIAYAESPQGWAEYWLEQPKEVRFRGFASAASGLQLHLAELQLQLEGRVMHTPVGAIHLKDLVAFEAADRSMAVGFVQKLLQHPDGSHWCLLLALESLGGAAYNKANGKYCLIPAAAVRGTFPYFSAGGRWYLVAPIDSFQ